jgi:UDP-glucuronate 4-epimerase
MKEELKILVTGSSGFIGMSLCLELLEQGYKVLGIDNMNDYYDVNLKKSRLEKLLLHKNYTFKKININNYELLNEAFEQFKPGKVVNLAAQAGVRYSIDNPHTYISNNIAGFMNILECVRHHKVKGVIYASSSSVYGGNVKSPFSESDRVDKQISIYGVTKRANELMAQSYSHLYNINTTGLRFFTVYGPWGRPDMALGIFAKKIIQNKELHVFNNGKMNRDFTYISDIISGLVSAIEKNYSCEIFNLGNNRSESVIDMIKNLETGLGKKARIKFLDIQLGDVKETLADIEYSTKKLGYLPSININEGILKFISWFKSYHGIP